MAIDWQSQSDQQQVRFELLDTVHTLISDEELRGSDRLRAAETLGKWLGMDRGLEPDVTELWEKRDERIRESRDAIERGDGRSVGDYFVGFDGDDRETDEASGGADESCRIVGGEGDL